MPSALLKKLPKPGIGALVTLAVLIAVSVLYLNDPPSLRVLRNAVFDQFQRWHPRTYEAAPVRVVDIDDESLRLLGQWPWPRTRVAALIDAMRAQGAAVIGFDVVFAEPDRTSPKAMVNLWNPPDDLRQRLLRIPDHDEAMTKAFGGGGMKFPAWMALMTVMVFSGAAWGQDAIGFVKTVTGDATVTDGGKAVKAVAGTPIKLNSVLKTGAKGTMGVTFKDNSVMSFGPDTEVTVDEYLYAPAKGDLKFGARMAKGTLNVVSGSIAKLKPEAVSLKTPTGSIGIRGTNYAIKVEPQ